MAVPRRRVSLVPSAHLKKGRLAIFKDASVITEVRPFIIKDTTFVEKGAYGCSLYLLMLCLLLCVPSKSVGWRISGLNDPVEHVLPCVPLPLGVCQTEALVLKGSVH